MKKIEVCIPVASLESLRTELAACGIVNPALMILCGWLNPGDPGLLGRKSQKTGKANHCKVEMVVSDRVAPRAVQIISDLLLARKVDAPASHLLVLDVGDNYHFEPS